MRKILRNYALIAAMLMASVVAFAQNNITGTVVDAETGEGLPGASVVVKGTTNGTITDFNGDFTLSVPDETLTIMISFVGFKTVEKTVDVSETLSLGQISLEAGANELTAVEVLASVAVERKTPVAVSSIKKAEILERASNQEFPELLKSTPGVYATKQGGGYGDSRINLRGFNSENVAVLINGVPVNDMENGRVYWSNWAGLTDVTSSMQVQRGLGASKVAVPSIGGTINILTQTTDAEAGGNVFYGIGNDNYNKGSFYVSTGLTEDGWAVSLSGAKITGDGYVDGTEFEGYNYFFNVSKAIGDDHTISLTGFGAPQRHGQRQSSLSVATLKDKGMRWNTDYGYLDGQVVHVEDNFYHKPQFSLNHYWNINKDTELSTALYVSTGTGGGGGSAGTLQRRYDGLYDLEATRDTNIANRTENGGDGNAIGYLRASRNDHKWYGLLSTLTNESVSNFTFMGGLDLRYYKGIHFSEVTNLLGAEYVLDDNDVNNPNRRLGVGDKRDYYNDGIVLWEGVFGQAEYTQGDLTVFASAALSNTSYQRIDYFQYTPDEQETDFYHFLGYQAKGGANYNLTRNHNVFANAGFFTKAPIFDAVFQGFSNTVNEDAEVQKIMSFELGYGYRSAKLTANANVYHTRWMDRTLIESVGDTLFANLQGVDAIHQGIELDFTYKPVQRLTINGMVSLGDWTWANDLNNVIIYDDNRNPVNEDDPLSLYIAGLKVGNAAQTTAALGVNFEAFKDFKIGALLNYFADNYKDYDPNDVTTPEAKDNVEVVVPEYYNLDINANYGFKFGAFDATVYGNINNVLDTEYITDWTSFGIYPGTGRQWTMGLRINF
ncbi:TonB-dependent receptor [Marinoscillum furvescens]|uniref:Outer membrane receptor protein involved in Fe transport n=1 Tax=Marinoscillum furvescens DSM 4134 TaxID=1122208 RepID=A0A3D9L3H2_MARFU|nr:carboxypeptidase-like regulatory domain-containing protein [Marinoscillum furvescens]RED97520.1 outer membrane receptor protein involved in Fe transport [Marinoscillum furvescens DSM 4134]